LEFGGIGGIIGAEDRRGGSVKVLKRSIAACLTLSLVGCILPYGFRCRPCIIKDSPPPDKTVALKVESINPLKLSRPGMANWLEVERGPAPLGVKVGDVIEGVLRGCVDADSLFHYPRKTQGECRTALTFTAPNGKTYFYSGSKEVNTKP
jgi:hypothetical protein